MWQLYIKKNLSEDYQIVPQTKTALALEVTNPFLTTDMQSGGYTLPIDLPNSDGNKLLFGFPNLPESVLDTNEYPARLSVEGIDWYYGIVYVIGADERSIRLSFIANNWDQNKRDKLLRTLTLGGVRNVSTTNGGFITHANQSVGNNASVNNWDYLFFPIWHERFAEGYGTPNRWLNAWFASGNTFQNLAQAAVPFPYLVYLLRQIAIDMGMTLAGDFSANAEIQKCVVFNNFDVGNTAPNVQINLQNHVPQDITIQVLLDSIRNLFNVAIYPDLSKGRLMMQFKTLPNPATATPDWTNRLSPYPTIDIKTDDGFKLTQTPDDEDDFYQFIKDYVLYADKALFATVANAGSLPANAPEGSVAYITNNQTWAVRRSTTWREIRYYGYGCTVQKGKGDLQITSQAGTLTMAKKPYPTGGTFLQLAPQTKQLGNTPSLPNVGQTNPYSLRFLFYRGKQPNSSGSLYPMGSSDVYNINGSIVGNTALRWWGTYGLYERRWKDWLKAISSNKSCTFRGWIAPQDIQEMDWQNAVFRHGSNTYLIEKINLNIPSYASPQIPCLIKAIRL